MARLDAPARAFALALAAALASGHACDANDAQILAITVDAPEVGGDSEGAPDPPGVPCGDAPGDGCEDGQVCDRLGCQVGAAGTCRDVPAQCPEEAAPVCGCDGKTYANDCLRRKAGVGRHHAGACGIAGSACGDLVGVVCGASLVCDRASCEVPSLGVCKARPWTCEAARAEPVCGCDGVTYASDCERLRAGAARRHDGVCAEAAAVCGTLTSPPCRTGEVCDVLGCGLGDPGVCTAIPEGCSTVFAPVCGCDGVTYANDCERLRSGARASHVGACGAVGTPCGGAAGIACAEGLACDRTRCGDAAEGVCAALPEVCGVDGAPVCGCDGVTYANDCERLRAGVGRAAKGPCEPPGKACGPIPDGGCPSGQVCMRDGCAPGVTGACVPLAVPCPDRAEPACGCDGVTYASLCDLRAAGVALDHAGPCVP